MTTEQTQAPVWVINSTGNIHTLAIYKSSAIEVHRHMDYPGKWLLSGKGLLSGIDRVILRSDDLEKAKEEAMNRVHFSLTNITESLGKMMPQKKG